MCLGRFVFCCGTVEAGEDEGEGEGEGAAESVEAMER